MTGESLVARRALNTHIKVDDAEQQRENISILNVTLAIRYVV